MKRAIFMVFAIMLSAGTCYGQQPATNERPVMTYGSAGQPPRQERSVYAPLASDVEVVALPGSSLEGSGPQLVEFHLSEADLARLRVFAGEFASNKRLTGPVKVEIRITFEGAMSSTPYLDNAQELGKELSEDLIRDTTNDLGYGVRNQLPYLLGDAADNAITKSGETAARIVVNPKDCQTFSFYVKIEAPSSGFFRENTVTFNYDVITYDNGTREVRVRKDEDNDFDDRKRLGVVNVDNRGSLHLAVSGRPGLKPKVNLGGLADVISAAVAIVEVGR